MNVAVLPTKPQVISVKLALLSLYTIITNAFRYLIHMKPNCRHIKYINIPLLFSLKDFVGVDIWKIKGAGEAWSSTITPPYTHLCYARKWLICLFSLTSVLFLTREIHTWGPQCIIFFQESKTHPMFAVIDTRSFLCQIIYFITLHLVFYLQYLHRHCLTSTF